LRAIKSYSLFLEGLVDDLRQKYASLSQEEFDALSNADPTPQKKYLRKLLQFNKEGYSIDILKDLIGSYHDLLNRNILQGADRDIQSFSKFQDFEDVVVLNKYKKTGQEKKKAISKGESTSSEVVYENENVIVRKIYNHEASCTYGKSTSWCITMNSDGYWKTYSNSQLLDFYFVEFKKAPLKNWNKVAVGVNIHNELKEIRDVKDKSIEEGLFFEKSNIPKDIFVNTFSKEAKSIEELISKLDRLDIHRFKILSLENSLVEIHQDVTIKTDLPFTISKLVGNLTISDTKLVNLPKAIEGTTILTNCIFPSETLLNTKKAILRDCKKLDNLILSNCKELTMSYCSGISNLVSLNLQKEMDKLHVSGCDITSLEGCPDIIHGNFIFYSNHIKSLSFGPQKVEGIYNVKLNELESLEGIAKEIDGNLDVSVNEKDFTMQDVPKDVTIKGKIVF